MPHRGRKAAPILILTLLVVLTAAACGTVGTPSDQPDDVDAPSLADDGEPDCEQAGIDQPDEIGTGDAAVEPASIHMFKQEAGWLLATSPPTQGKQTRVFHAEDGGRHWSSVTPQELPPGDASAYFLDEDVGWIAGLLEDPDAGRTDVIGSDREVSVFRTVDGGQTWAENTFSTPHGWRLHLYFVDADNGWMLDLSSPAAAQMEKTLFRTTDGGRSWEKVSASTGEGDDGLPAGGYPYGVVFSTPSRGWMAGSPRGEPHTYLFKTVDAGRTWAHQPLDQPEDLAQRAQDTLAPTVFGETGTNGILFQYVHGPPKAVVYPYVTDDGGSTWDVGTPFETTMDYQPVYSFPDPQHGWVAGQGDRHLYQTDDGGEMWTKLTPNVDFSGVEALAFASKKRGWAVIQVAQQPQLFRTNDGGHRWVAAVNECAG